MEKKEVRILQDNSAEIRAEGSGRTVSGTGVVFNSPSADLGGFIEIILPSAVNNVLNKSDILFLMNHQVERGCLARSSKGKGSLTLKADNKALNYSFQAPAFALGDELLENIKRGDIKGSSFSFAVAKGGDTWEKRDGKNIRTISQFDAIYDISAVYRPAYPDTQIALRSLAEFEKQPAKRNITDDMTPSQRFEYEKFQDLKLKDDRDKETRQQKLWDEFQRLKNKK